MSARLSAKDYRALTGKKRGHKYGAKADLRCEACGSGAVYGGACRSCGGGDVRRFDSKAEAARWDRLRLLEQAGEITELRCQVRYPLHVFPAGQDPVCIGHYVADFDYVDTASGERISEDVKGAVTQMFKWKAKHFAAEYEREIKVTR